jgi:hypothetical protein
MIFPSENMDEPLLHPYSLVARNSLKREFLGCGSLQCLAAEEQKQENTQSRSYHQRLYRAFLLRVTGKWW